MDFQDYDDENEVMNIDDEIFMSEIPEHIIQNSIKNQFKHPLENRKRDHVQSFITKYEFLKNQLTEAEDEDALAELSILHDEFIKFMISIFEVKLGVGIDNLDTMDEDDIHELIQITYRFFIKNIRKNFINLISNWIEENREILLNDLPQKKNITFLSLKSEGVDEEDILIIANLQSIISDCLFDVNERSDVDNFFDLCDKDEATLETDFVRSKYDEFILTGNFIPYYIKMIEKTDGVLEIATKIRSKILKKYNKRIKKEITKAIEEE